MPGRLMPRLPAPGSASLDGLFATSRMRCMERQWDARWNLRKSEGGDDALE